MWLHIPSTQSQSVAASADSTADSEQLARRLERSCTWSGKSRPQASWRRACKTAYWMPRLSGLTLEPSQAQSAAITFAKQLAAEASTLSSAGRHAKDFPLPESNSAPTTREINSPTPCGQSSTTGHGLCSLKTSPDHAATCPKGLSLYCTGGAIECRDRFCWKPQPLELRRSGSDCFCWQSPMTPNGGRIGARTEEGREGADSGLEFVSQSWNWPAARSEDGEACGNHPVAMDSLTGVTTNWATPNIPNRGMETAESKAKGGGGGEDLQTQASLWLSPHGMAGIDSTGKAGAGGEFAEETTKWMQPGANDFKVSAKMGQRCGQLDEQAEHYSAPSHQAPALDLTALLKRFSLLSKAERAAPMIAFLRSLLSTRSGNASSKSGQTSRQPSAKTKRRRLNQAFVTWLMNFPEGWTSLEPISSAP